MRAQPSLQTSPLPPKEEESTAVYPSLPTLPLPQGEGLFADIHHLQAALAMLQDSLEVESTQSELADDLSDLQAIFAEICTPQTLDEQLRLYQVQYQPIATQLKAKYHDQVNPDQWRAIAEYESYVEAIKKLRNIESSIAKAFTLTVDSDKRYAKMYDAAMDLTTLLEQYVSSFYPGLVQSLRELILRILDDADFQRNCTHHNNIQLPCPISLRASARAALWQLEHLNRTAPSREIQIQKNRPSMEWLEERMDSLKAEISAIN